MDFPSPRDDPVTRITLASSATIFSEEDDLGVNANGVAGAKADDAAAERRTRVADNSFMVDLFYEYMLCLVDDRVVSGGVDRECKKGAVTDVLLVEQVEFGLLPMTQPEPSLLTTLACAALCCCSDVPMRQQPMPGYRDTELPVCNTTRTQLFPTHCILLLHYLK
jgi:hypothetical protein